MSGDIPIVITEWIGSLEAAANRIVKGEMGTYVKRKLEIARPMATLFRSAL